LLLGCDLVVCGLWTTRLLQLPRVGVMCSIYRGVCLPGMAGQVAPMFSLTRVDAIPVVRVGEPCGTRRALAPSLRVERLHVRRAWTPGWVCDVHSGKVVTIR
jgi:hypothetical protein